MKVFRLRDVRLPERGTNKSSGIDFFIPNDIIDLYNAENCKFTPSDLLTNEVQKSMKDNNFVFNIEEHTETVRPYINIPAGYGLLIPSWIKIELTDVTSGRVYDLVFADKSWIATKLWLTIWAKVVDYDYQWEIHIHLINTTKFNIPVYPCQKIVQWIIREVVMQPIIEVEEGLIHTQNTDRWAWGFGSTWN